jgi:predicted transcriptional regulator
MKRTKRKPADKYLSGEEVRVWRAARDLTLQEVSSWLGQTPQAFSNYETRGASRLVALAIAAVDRGLKPLKLTDRDYQDARSNIKKDSDEA